MRTFLTSAARDSTARRTNRTHSIVQLARDSAPVDFSAPQRPPSTPTLATWGTSVLWELLFRLLVLLAPSRRRPTFLRQINARLVRQATGAVWLPSTRHPVHLGFMLRKQVRARAPRARQAVSRRLLEQPRASHARPATSVTLLAQSPQRSAVLGFTRSSRVRARAPRARQAVSRRFLEARRASFVRSATTVPARPPSPQRSAAVGAMRPNATSVSAWIVPVASTARQRPPSTLFRAMQDTTVLWDLRPSLRARLAPLQLPPTLLLLSSARRAWQATGVVWLPSPLRLVPVGVMHPRAALLLASLALLASFRVKAVSPPAKAARQPTTASLAPSLQSLAQRGRGTIMEACTKAATASIARWLTIAQLARPPQRNVLRVLLAARRASVMRPSAQRASRQQRACRPVRGAIFA